MFVRYLKKICLIVGNNTTLAYGIVILCHSFNKFLYRSKARRTYLVAMTCFYVQQTITMIYTIFINDIFTNI